MMCGGEDTTCWTFTGVEGVLGVVMGADKEHGVPGAGGALLVFDKDKSASAALVADPSLLSTTSTSSALSSAESVQESAILARAERRGDTAGRAGDGRVGVGGAEGVGDELEEDADRDLGVEGFEGVTGTERTGELDFERGDPDPDLEGLVERDLDTTEVFSSLSESESESD